MMKMDWEPVNMLSQQIASESSTRSKVRNLNNVQLKSTGSNSKTNYFSEFEKFLSNKSIVKLSEIHNNFSHHKTLTDDSEDLQRSIRQNEKSDILYSGSCLSNKNTDENLPPQLTVKPDIPHNNDTCNAKKVLKVRIERLSSEKICKMDQPAEYEIQGTSTEDSSLESKTCSTSEDICVTEHCICLQNECEQSTIEVDVQPTNDSLFEAQNCVQDNKTAEPLNSLLKRMNIKPSFVSLTRLPFTNNNIFVINKDNTLANTETTDSSTSNENSIKTHHKTLNNCNMRIDENDQQESSLSCTNNATDTKDEVLANSLSIKHKTLKNKSVCNKKMLLQQKSARKRRKLKNISYDYDIPPNKSTNNTSVNPLQYNITNAKRDDTAKPKQLIRNKNSSISSLQTKLLSLNRSATSKVVNLMKSSYSLRNSSKCEKNKISVFNKEKKFDSKIIKIKQTKEKKTTLNTSSRKERKSQKNINFITKESRNKIKQISKPLCRKSRSLSSKQMSSGSKNNPKIIPNKIILNSKCKKIEEVSNPERNDEKKTPILNMINHVSKNICLQHLQQENMITCEEQSKTNYESTSTEYNKEFHVEAVNQIQGHLLHNNSQPICTNVLPESPPHTITPVKIIERLQLTKVNNLTTEYSPQKLENSTLTVDLKPKLECTYQLNRVQGQTAFIWQKISGNEKKRKCIVINNSARSAYNQGVLKQPLQCAIYSKPTTFNYGRRMKYNHNGRWMTSTVYQPYSLASLALQTFFGRRIIN